jgi:Concanavalin A-like lectin/glucanases superfamily
MKIINFLFSTTLVLCVLAVISTDSIGQSFLTDGLVAYFPFNGNANDALGVNNGAVYGAVLGTDRFGVPNAAYSFNSSSSYIDLGSPSSLGFRGDFTITAWCLFSGGAAQNPRIISFGGGGNGYELLTAGNGTSRAFQFNCSTNYFNTRLLYPENVWYAVAAVVSGNTSYIYVNGVLAGVGLARSAPSFAANLHIGNNSKTTEWDWWGGLIDDVRFYNRTLSPNEIAGLYSVESDSNNFVYAHTKSELPIVNPPTDPIDPKTGLPLSESEAPTNNFIEIDNGAGEVRALDPKGLIIETTNFQYLPRIQIEDLSNEALFALFDNKTAYAALTTFGNPKARVPESENFESKMRSIWDSQKSLNDKIETRLTILREMKDYNVAASDYRQKIGVNSSIQQSATDAQKNAGYEATIKIGNDALAGIRPFGYDRESRNIIYTAKKQQGQIADEAATAANAAVGAAIYANGIQQVIQKDLAACQLHASHLADYGIQVPNAPPFGFVPPLSLRYEIELERASN